MTPSPDFRPVSQLGTLLLGFGLAARLLVPGPPVTSAVEHALPAIALIAGAGCVLLDRMLRRGNTLPWTILLLPVLTVPGFLPATPLGVAKGFDFVAAIAAGLALRDLVLRDGLKPALLQTLLSIALLVTLIGVAQWAYQRDEARDAAAALQHQLTATERGRAFLASGRAYATLVNPNVFGGFLVLIAPLLLGTRPTGSTRSSRLRIAVLASVFALGLLAAGSAGALLALLLAAGALLRLRPHAAKPLRIAGGIGFLLGIVGLLALLASLVFPAAASLLGTKATTFAERLAYHRLGARLLDRTGWHGIGFEATSDLGLVVLRPLEPWSAYLHDSWLQLVLEGGPIVLLALAPLYVAMRRVIRGGEPRKAGIESPPDRSPFARPLLGGALLGAAVAPWLGRMATVLPLGLESTGLSGAANAGVVAGAMAVLGTPAFPGRSGRGALAVGVGAALLHNLIDFDLYVAGFATALAAVLALFPAGRALAAPSALQGLLAVTLLLLPVPIGLQALKRDQVAMALQAISHPPSRDEALAILRQEAGNDPEAIGPVVLEAASGDPALAERLLDRLHPVQRESPRARKLEARYLSRRTLHDHRFADEAARRLAELRRPGERADAEILYHSSVVHLVAGKRGKAEALAGDALAAARAWRLDAEDAPFLGELASIAGVR